jgi:hypothetical protein
MRLIHTGTYELYEFSDKQIPLYAILSHRWENDEVTFQDLRGGRGPNMAGWGKILGCCAQAAKNGWKYAVSAFLFRVHLPMRFESPTHPSPVDRLVLYRQKQ